MSVDIETLIDIMKQIQEHDYVKSRQVAQFIEDVIEHFYETRSGD